SLQSVDESILFGTKTFQERSIAELLFVTGSNLIVDIREKEDNRQRAPLEHLLIKRVKDSHGDLIGFRTHIVRPVPHEDWMQQRSIQAPPTDLYQADERREVQRPAVIVDLIVIVIPAKLGQHARVVTQKILIVLRGGKGILKQDKPVIFHLEAWFREDRIAIPHVKRPKHVDVAGKVLGHVPDKHYVRMVCRTDLQITEVCLDEVVATDAVIQDSHRACHGAQLL